MRTSLLVLFLIAFAVTPLALAQKHDRKESPFEQLRWKEGQPEVQVAEIWYTPISIDGVAVERILAHCEKRWPGDGERRFGEDLVEAMMLMGHTPPTKVELVLRRLDDGESVTLPDVVMSRENRTRIRDAGRDRERPPRQPIFLERDAAVLDLDAFAAGLRDQFAYYAWRGIDLDAELAALREELPDRMRVGWFADRLNRILLRFGDGHARVSSPDATDKVGYAPALLLQASGGDGVVAVHPDRSGFLDAERPYLKTIDGESVEVWLDAMGAFVVDGSPQLVRRRALRGLADIVHLREHRGLAASTSVRYGLVARPGKKKAHELELELIGRAPSAGTWPRTRTGRLEESIGYLRIESMSDRRISDLHAAMADFRETTGLIVDVRGNGGGSRGLLLALAGYLLGPDEKPWVGNVAAYKKSDSFDDDHLEARFMREGRVGDGVADGVGTEPARVLADRGVVRPLASSEDRARRGGAALAVLQERQLTKAEEHGLPRLLVRRACDQFRRDGADRQSSALLAAGAVGEAEPDRDVVGRLLVAWIEGDSSPVRSDLEPLEGSCVLARPDEHHCVVCALERQAEAELDHLARLPRDRDAADRQRSLDGLFDAQGPWRLAHLFPQDGETRRLARHGPLAAQELSLRARDLRPLVARQLGVGPTRVPTQAEAVEQHLALELQLGVEQARHDLDGEEVLAADRDGVRLRVGRPGVSEERPERLGIGCGDLQDRRLDRGEVGTLPSAFAQVQLVGALEVLDVELALVLRGVLGERGEGDRGEAEHAGKTTVQPRFPQRLTDSLSTLGPLDSLERSMLRPLLLLLTALPATAQVRFSIDWHGPTKGRPATGSHVPITEGDILMPPVFFPVLGPLPAPRIALPVGPGGLNLPAAAGCNTPPPIGVPCMVEVDALSLGREPFFTPNQPIARGRLWLSVDEFARGAVPPAPAPSIASEWVWGDTSADAFLELRALPPGPLGPGTPGGVGPQGSRGVLDGDGQQSASGHRYPGLGLIEPNPPSNTPPPDDGDNLDALDVHDAHDAHDAPARVFFSLDGTVVDPINGALGSGSAAANGGSAADVFVAFGSATAPVVWAQASQLGLDVQGEDDLDALILHDNGNNTFEPSNEPYDWVGGARDMLLFSVRRGSAVIGRPDSIYGIPIAPGDVLTTPLASSAGGVSPFPGIFIAAEVLGLRAGRSGPSAARDDIDALDLLTEAFFDCNGNDVEDSVDIAVGTSNDDNLNGVPDECETVLVRGCFCNQNAPCGNASAGAGCRNSTGSGARLVAGGSTSVSRDDLVLVTVDVPPEHFGLYFMGNAPTAAPVPFGDGLRCTGGMLLRWPVENVGAGGALVLGPQLADASLAFPPLGHLVPGSTWSFQAWFRDPAGPCGSGWNASNALFVSFVP
ncbi:MAG: hypothetical protein GY711_02985 [bacterium]|nr:hypothetical protein [bacterium]